MSSSSNADAAIQAMDDVLYALTTRADGLCPEFHARSGSGEPAATVHTGVTLPDARDAKIEALQKELRDATQQNKAFEEKLARAELLNKQLLTLQESGAKKLDEQECKVEELNLVIAQQSAGIIPTTAADASDRSQTLTQVVEVDLQTIDGIYAVEANFVCLLQAQLAEARATVAQIKSEEQSCHAELKKSAKLAKQRKQADGEKARADKRKELQQAVDTAKVSVDLQRHEYQKAIGAQKQAKNLTMTAKQTLEVTPENAQLKALVKTAEANQKRADREEKAARAAKEKAEKKLAGAEKALCDFDAPPKPKSKSSKGTKRKASELDSHLHVPLEDIFGRSDESDADQV